MSLLSVPLSVIKEGRSPCHHASSDQVVSQDLDPEGALLPPPPKVGVGKGGHLYCSELSETIPGRTPQQRAERALQVT